MCWDMTDTSLRPLMGGAKTTQVWVRRFAVASVSIADSPHHSSSLMPFHFDNVNGLNVALL